MTLQQKLLAKQSKKGFTLVELVVVIAILGILAAIAIPSVIAIINSANESSAQTDAATVDAACKDYYSVCVAGKAPDEGKSKTEIRDFTNKATINDALDYANIKDSVSLGDMAVDASGTIFDAETEPNRAKDDTKTALLSKPGDEGSLKALYAGTSADKPEDDTP